MNEQTAQSPQRHGATAPAVGLSAITAGNYEPLTALPNAAYLRELLRQRLGEAARTVAQCALFQLNLDRFASINDAFGRATGDALLAQVARRIEATANANDVVAHLEQDDFALFVDGVENVQAARTYAERLLRVLRRPLFQNGQTFYLTASIGAVVAPAAALDPNTVLDQARRALAEAKHSGRNTFRICFPDEAPHEGSPELESALANALARDELFLLYQPILNLRTRRISGAEALLRWRHPKQGTLTPDRFVPLANRTGLIAEIGDWVLHQACAQARRWQKDGFTQLGVSVNLSAAQLTDRAAVRRIEAALASTGLAARFLDLETEEAGPMLDEKRAMDNLHGLKELGAKLSLDNFGTGLVSLPALGRMPIDALKIDRSLVRTAAPGAGTSILRTLTALGKSLDLGVVAGGVETTEQLDLMDREGCDHIQGYLLSKPQSPAGILGLLHKYNPPVGDAPV